MLIAAPALSRRSAAAFAGAYRQTSVHTGVEAASPHRLVAMLFDGLLEAMAQARGAIVARDGELKGRAIGRAVRIVDEGLRGSLDLNAGGALAADLHALYGYVAQRLTLANLRHDATAIDECRRLVEPLRDAWLAIAPQVERGVRA